MIGVALLTLAGAAFIAALGYAVPNLLHTVGNLWGEYGTFGRKAR